MSNLNIAGDIQEDKLKIIPTKSVAVALNNTTVTTSFVQPAKTATTNGTFVQPSVSATVTVTFVSTTGMDVATNVLMPAGTYSVASVTDATTAVLTLLSVGNVAVAGTVPTPQACTESVPVTFGSTAGMVAAGTTTITNKGVYTIASVTSGTVAVLVLSSNTGGTAVGGTVASTSAVTTGAFDITASFPYATELYVGVTGDVIATLIHDSTAQTYKAVPVGVLKGMFTSVTATGTTATNIIARK